MPDVIIIPATGELQFIKEGAQSPQVHKIMLAEAGGLTTNTPFSASAGMFAPNMLDTNGNNTFFGTTTFQGPTVVNGNLSVFGNTNVFSASNIYLSSSTLTVEDNIITLNAFSPFLRYAGIEMFDSGSGTLSQLLWDGQGDYFFLSGSGVNGKLITGPDGQSDLTSNYVPKATSGYKLGNSLIYDNGTNVGISTSSPNGKLTIVGDGSLNGYSGVLRVSDTAGTKWAGIGLPDAQGTTTNANNYYLIGRGGSYSDRIMSFHLPNAADYGSGAQPKLGIYSTGADLLHSIEASTGTSYFKGNVGIGQTNPGGVLDIQSSNTGDQLVRTWNTNTAGTGKSLLRIANSGNNAQGSQLQFTDNNYFVGTIASDRTNGMTFYVGQQASALVSERMRIDINGNVGINTSSPNYKLQVSGSTFSTTLIGNTITDGYITINSGDLLFANDNGGDGFQFDYYNTKLYMGNSAGSTWHMVIQDNGNVGIGVTNPTQKLDVVGSYGTAGDDTGILKIRGGNTGADTQLNFGVSADGGYGWIQTTDVGLSNDRSIILNPIGGNIGIGTTSPSYKLDVNAGVQDVARFYNNQTSFGLLMGSTANTLFTNLLWTTSTGNAQFFKNRSSTSWGGADSFNFYTSNGGFAWHPAGTSNAMYLTDGGNLGIGTTNPATKLSIAGADNKDSGPILTLHGNATNQTESGRIRFCESNPLASPFYQGAFIHYDGGANVFNIGVHGNADSLTASDVNAISIDRSTANVGIGTTGPSRKLHIYSSGLSDNSINPLLLIDGKFTAAGVDSNDIVGIAFRVENSAGGSQTSTCIGSSYQGTGNALLLQPVSGNVGVGTINPSFKFEIGAGTSDVVVAKLTQGYERVRFYGFDLIGYNDGNLWMLGNNASNGLILGGSWDWDRQIAIVYTPGTTGAAGGSLEIGQLTKNNANYTHGNTRFYTNGVERMRIISNGNVGIGTSSPGAKLQVIAGNSTGISLFSNNGGQYAYQQIGRTSSELELGVVGGANQFFTGTVAGDAIIKQNSTGKIHLGYGSAAPSITIDSSNNVGIGTISPLARLQVNSPTAGATLLRADGTSGTLFSVVDDLSDSLMSVNNAAGLPVLEVFADDRIVAGQYGQNDLVVRNNKVGVGMNNPSAKLHVTGSTGAIFEVDTAGNTTTLYVNSSGNVGVNTTDFSYTTSDNSRLVGSNTNNKLFVNGSIQLLGNNDAIVFGRGTATFLTDEELGFGWGGGWYMTDSTWVRVRNDKYIYGGSGVIRTDGEFQLGGSGAYFLANSTETKVASAVLRVITDSITAANAGTRGFILDGNYTNGQYRHRWRKYDDGSGVPLYIDYAHGTANSYTALARFGGGGTYNSFTVYGTQDITGNLGVGTTSPSTRLHIYENANRVTYIAQNNNHTARFEAYGTATAIDTTASNGIFFRINGGDIVKFAADGNVGIGTNTVTAKVESYFSSNAITINYLATNLNNNSPIPVYGFDVTNGSGETRSIKAGIGYERHLVNGRGAIHFYNDSTNDTQSLSGNRTSAGDIKMTIQNDGNVGIGYVQPTYTLAVNGTFYVNSTGYFNGSLTVDDNLNLTAGNDFIITDSDGTGTYNFFMDSGVGYIRIDDGGSANGKLNINSGLLYVGASGGNVGINTTSPSWLLTVYAATAPQFTLQNGTRSFILTNNSADNLLSFNYASANRLQFDLTNQWFNTGNLGIGTTSPSALLNVRASAPAGTGTVTTGTNILIDSNTNNYITFRNTADNGTYAGLVFLDNNVGGYIAFGNAGAAVGSDSMIYGAYQDHIFQNNYVNETLYNRTETMRIKQSGNVGIGTSNPGRKLDVEGIVRTRGASGTGGFEISAASSGAAKWRIEWDSASDSLDFNWVG